MKKNIQICQLERGAGKTTQLINLADNRNGYIVCFSKTEARRIFKEAQRLNKNIALPITYSEFENYHGYPVPFYFDNFEFYIQNLVANILNRQNIKAITLTDNYSITELINQQG